MKNKNTREHSYQEMKKLGKNPEFSVILNKIRDKCVKKGNFEDIIKIKSKSKKTEKALNSLFKDTLNLKFNLKLWTRELMQYGDFFLFINIDKIEGIYDFMILPVNEINREEGFNGNKDTVRFKWETTNEYFEDWQLIHFRNIENLETLPYGRPIFNSKGQLKGEDKNIIEDIREAMIIGLKKIANTHFYILGQKKGIDNFSIKFN